MISPLDGVTVRLTKCSSALSKSGLYDIDYALNPYRGCAHGCLYCYAPDVIKCDRSSNWGSWVEARTNISRVLRKEISAIGRSVIGLATVTDPYQACEERLGITRSCLEVISHSDASLMLMTKSPLARRDFDLLRKVRELEFCVTITTLDEALARRIEPRAPSPAARVGLLQEAADAGFRTCAMVSPWIISTDDPENELSELIETIARTGCRSVTIDRLRLRPYAAARLRDSDEESRLAKSEIADIRAISASIGKHYPDIRFEFPMP